MLRCRSCDVKESVDVMHCENYALQIVGSVLQLGLKLAASSLHLTIYGAHQRDRSQHGVCLDEIPVIVTLLQSLAEKKSKVCYSTE